jgi:hypothetical protein
MTGLLPGVDEDEADARMRVDSNPLVGIMAASLAAGPVCLFLLCLGDTVHAVHHGGASSYVLRSIWWGFPLLFARASLICFVATIIPNAIGSIALGMLGTILPDVRRWAVWPIAGGSIALLLPILLDGRTAPYDAFLYSAAIGATCAAICRLFTRWEPT